MNSTINKICSPWIIKWLVHHSLGYQIISSFKKIRRKDIPKEQRKSIDISKREGVICVLWLWRSSILSTQMTHSVVSPFMTIIYNQQYYFFRMKILNHHQESKDHLTTHTTHSIAIYLLYANSLFFEVLFHIKKNKSERK